MKRLTTILGIFLASSLLVTAAWAQPMGGPPMMGDGPPMMGGPQGPPPDGGPDGMDAGGLAQNFFRPQLVLRNAEEIGLTSDQREKLKKEMKETESAAFDLKWGIEEARSALEKLVSAPQVDEAKAMAQVEKLMELEQKMKKAQMRLLIRVKNLLTAEQQEKLEGLREGMMRGVRQRRSRR